MPVKYSVCGVPDGATGSSSNPLCASVCRNGKEGCGLIGPVATRVPRRQQRARAWAVQVSHSGGLDSKSVGARNTESAKKRCSRNIGFKSPMHKVSDTRPCSNVIR